MSKDHQLSTPSKKKKKKKRKRKTNKEMENRNRKLGQKRVSADGRLITLWVF